MLGFGQQEGKRNGGHTWWVHRRQWTQRRPKGTAKKDRQRRGKPKVGGGGERNSGFVAGRGPGEDVVNGTAGPVVTKVFLTGKEKKSEVSEKRVYRISWKIIGFAILISDEI